VRGKAADRSSDGGVHKADGRLLLREETIGVIEDLPADAIRYSPPASVII